MFEWFKNLFRPAYEPANLPVAKTKPKSKPKPPPAKTKPKPPPANTELPWMKVARSHVGLKEIAGKKHNKTIIEWLNDLDAWWFDDEVPWCGTYIAQSLVEAGFPIIKHWYRAKAWNEYGKELKAPCYGCLVIFSRKGGGHVGFVTGMAADGRLMVLGGNQNNQVSIAPFDIKKRPPLGYRFPKGISTRGRGLSTMIAEGSSSTNEA